MSLATAPRGNVVGIDPHKRTLSASVLDERGALLGHRHFRVSGEGHRELERWALSFGPVARFGVEGAGGLGRHTAIFLALIAGQDVRDVCANRTATRARARGQGKSDVLDAERIARETLAHADLALAFKRAPGEAGPDEAHELIRLWHNARRSLLKSRQHLLNECEGLIGELPEPVRAALPDTKAVRPRLAALRARRRPRALDAPDALRLGLLAERARDRGSGPARARGRQGAGAPGRRGRLDARGSARAGRAAWPSCWSRWATRVASPRAASPASNASAPVPASSGEGAERPRRHRLNRGGNRRVNAVLHRMAVTQLRCEPRAQAIIAGARQRGHTKREAIRILKRHLSNAIWRRMIRDQEAHRGPGCQADVRHLV